MIPAATVLACGMLDRGGIYGSNGTAVTWAELEADPPGTGRTVHKVSGKTDTTFRRIDYPSRALVLACEAAGIDAVEAIGVDRDHVGPVGAGGIGKALDAAGLAEQMMDLMLVEQIFGEAVLAAV